MSLALRTASRASVRPVILASGSSVRRSGYATTSSVQSSEAAGGIKIAASDAGAPTAAISVVVKAGSRYETAPGLAHVLRNSLFKRREREEETPHRWLLATSLPSIAGGAEYESIKVFATDSIQMHFHSHYKATNKRSAIRLVRETEMLGGVLSSSLSREHLVLTAEFIKGNEAYFAEVLGDAIGQAKLSPHEYNEEVLPQVASEYEQAIRDPTTYALDLAHGLAFRAGLGNSLFASPHTAVDYTSAVSYAKAAFAPSNVAVLGSGIDAGSLSKLVSQHFTSSASAAGSLSAPATKYFGGEVRVPLVGHGSALDTFLLAFEGGASSDLNFAVLQSLLGGEASVKWSKGLSPLAQLASGSSSAKAVNLAYSDAGLFGILIHGASDEVGSVAQKALAEVQKIAKGVDGEAVKQAIAKAKFNAAAALESRVGSLEVLGAQLSASGKVQPLEDLFAALDKVSAESVTKAAAKMLKSKPTTVAVGDSRKLPCESHVTGRVLKRGGPSCEGKDELTS
ncbi:BQ2448_5108 [Microbotryum intermedium]|uniref:Cytochrome b-c1 complex subunit 2, mitochondrial n=1 Tax=Microbotryum intermedium TaxID=269621 RepID=A0A238F372_9BASI|nr:BQ2448_5108 [Microbotryum intermedium]